MIADGDSMKMVCVSLGIRIVIAIHESDTVTKAKQTCWIDDQVPETSFTTFPKTKVMATKSTPQNVPTTSDNPGNLDWDPIGGDTA
jgi:hypothetical protein